MTDKTKTLIFRILLTIIFLSPLMLGVYSGITMDPGIPPMPTYGRVIMMSVLYYMLSPIAAFILFMFGAVLNEIWTVWKWPPFKEKIND